MHMKAFQCILTFLALQGAVHASVSPVAECTARAWVRAPDLIPDTIIQGDTRVKISVGCPAAETVSLGLRLKERSFMKILHSEEDRKWMKSAQSPHAIHPRFSDYNDDIRLQEMLHNKDLWFIREEERVVFETTQAIRMTKGTDRGSDIVQDFAILVPSTNFPPGVDYSMSGFIMADDMEMSNVEFMYEYFVRIPFSNGTTREISAGVTSFQPLYDPADSPRWSSSETILLESFDIADPRRNLTTSYTAQVAGLVFTQGSENQGVTVVITRTGPARTYTEPLTVRACVEPTFSTRWAVEYDIPSSQSLHRSDHVLRSTPEDIQDAEHYWGMPSCFVRDAVFVVMPNSTSDEVQSHNIVTTTSAAVTIPVKVPRRQITNFETYYQTLANSLRIVLESPCTDDETVDPALDEIPYNWGPKFADDEEPWVPWEKVPESEMPRPGMWPIWDTYSGNVPVVVRPVDEVMQYRLHPGVQPLGQVVLSGETGCEQRSLIHYLDEGARGPIFMDSGTIYELLTENPAERQLRAPILKPVVSFPPEGEVLIYRYHHYSYEPLIYVGETWVKKVAYRNQY